jgi:hypothetical protein
VGGSLIAFVRRPARNVSRNSCHFTDPGRVGRRRGLATTCVFRDGGDAAPLAGGTRLGIGRSARHTPLARSAICVRRLDDSRNSAIRLKYRDSLRFSSLREPRYPSMRVVLRFWFWFKSASLGCVPGCFKLRGPMARGASDSLSMILPQVHLRNGETCGNGKFHAAISLAWRRYL